MSGWMSMRRSAAVGLALVALGGVAAGCGGDDSDAPAAAATPTPDNAAALRDTTAAPPLPDRTGAAPQQLVTRDVVEGKGRKAKAGDQLTMQYTGWLYDTGEQFDSSWDRGEPIDLELGAGQVIKGWDTGIAGMRVGGRRVLTIPAKDAYGDKAQQSIPANSPLIFVVDLQKIGSSAATG